MRLVCRSQGRSGLRPDVPARRRSAHRFQAARSRARALLAVSHGCRCDLDLDPEKTPVAARHDNRVRRRARVVHLPRLAGAVAARAVLGVDVRLDRRGLLRQRRVVSAAAAAARVAARDGPALAAAAHLRQRGGDAAGRDAHGLPLAGGDHGLVAVRTHGLDDGDGSARCSAAEMDSAAHLAQPSRRGDLRARAGTGRPPEHRGRHPHDRVG